MSSVDIPLDKAELLSTSLEAILYGFSLLMFGGTIWVLLFRRSSQRVNRKMFTVACTLLVLSTSHLVIHMNRVMEGLILYADTYPGGPNAFFGDVSQWTFVWKNNVYIAQTLVGDAVVLYRCYSVWQSKVVMILPALLWCATGITGFGANYATWKVSQNRVFGGAIGQWITAYWVMALSTNFLTTVLLAWRIWRVDRNTRRSAAHRKSQLRPVLHIVIDAGALYTLTLLAGLICFVSKTNAQYVTLDMVTPMISIAFYMVIIRVGLASQGNQSTNTIPLTHTSTGNASSNADRRNRMEVHVTTLTESKIENNGLILRPTPGTPDSHENQSNEIKASGIEMAV